MSGNLVTRTFASPDSKEIVSESHGMIVLGGAVGLGNVCGSETVRGSTLTETAHPGPAPL